MATTATSYRNWFSLEVVLNFSLQATFCIELLVSVFTLHGSEHARHVLCILEGGEDVLLVPGAQLGGLHLQGDHVWVLLGE